MREKMSFKLFTKYLDGWGGADLAGNGIPDLWGEKSESFASIPSAARCVVKGWARLGPKVFVQCTDPEVFGKGGRLMEVDSFICEERDLEVDARADG